MVDYNKIQQEIENMKSGATKWIGNDFELNDMQGVHHFLISLEDEGIIDIIALGHESHTGHRLVHKIKIEKN
ncbi:hypothetical protein [Acinetobacter sp. CS-2]|uniref:hypothetical protein n=1 Tax=Acinetobacter sp. CS-2 TaxID=2798861 RepID=UPI001905BC57|nr:hypothetical protein [Acinetobacter sp. CS-2]QQN41027.1 hypothetical protein JFY49_07850 [Acinetobacter sp. CS-2]